MAEFLVPMKFTISGVAFVEADDAEEANRKARGGAWTVYETSTGEISDWEITGDAEENV